MRVVTKKLLKDLEKKAKNSPRKRSHFLFHEHSDPLQRMVNAIEPGTYVPPHKHQKPDKYEAFIILRGRAACFEFDDQGKIIDVHVLDENGPEYAVDVPPRTWHSFLALKPGTALFEVVQGPFNEKTHKILASWAPKEDEIKDSKKYLRMLKKELKNWNL